MPILKNQRHEKFAQNVALGMSAAEAYEKAGYRPHRQSAHKLLTNPDIQSRVQELIDKGASKAEVSVSRVLEEMACVAFADMGQYVDVDENGNVSVNFKKLSDGDLRAVTKLRQKHMKGEDGATIVETQFELASKTTGLEQLAKHLGMFIERSKVEHDVRYVVGETMSDEDKVTDNAQWSDKFADVAKSPRPGANGANGHS